MRLCVCVFWASLNAKKKIEKKKMFKPKGPLRVKKKNIVVVVLKIVCK